MLSVIDEIIEIDKNARNRIAEANEKVREIQKNAELQVEEIRREYNERINKRLEIVTENYSKFAEDEIGTIIAKEKESTEKLEKAMKLLEQNCRKEIINRITGTENAEK